MPGPDPREVGDVTRATRRALLRAGLVAAIGGAVLGGGSVTAAGAAVTYRDESRSAMPGPGQGLLSAAVVFRAAATQNRIALTFDDGPDPRWTPIVLDLLTRHQVPATFFVVGARAVRHPQLVELTRFGGHPDLG